MVTGMVAEGALEDGFELLEPVFVVVATGLTLVILPLTVLPSGSWTVTGSCAFASLCLVASRSTVTTRLVEVVLRIGVAVPPPFPDPEGLLLLDDGDFAELGLAELGLEELELLGLPVLGVLDGDLLPEPLAAVFSSAWRSLFCVCRSWMMASRPLLGVPGDSG
jgi:hypothetical protein